jgi:hypothetical protein
MIWKEKIQTSKAALRRKCKHVYRTTTPQSISRLCTLKTISYLEIQRIALEPYYDYRESQENICGPLKPSNLKHSVGWEKEKIHNKTPILYTSFFHTPPKFLLYYIGKYSHLSNTTWIWFFCFGFTIAINALKIWWGKPIPQLLQITYGHASVL